MSLLAHPVVAALDATCALLVGGLSRQSVYVAVVFLLVLGAARLLRRAPARVHAGLWAVVLLRLVLPPGLAAPWSARAMLGDFGMLGDLGIPGLAAAGPAAEAGSLDGLIASGTALREAGPAGGRAPAFPWSLAATVAWLAGVLAVAGRLARRRRRYSVLVREAAPVSGGPALQRCDEIRRRLGIARPVRLVTSEGAAPAFTLGVLRPVVHVPGRFLRAGGGALDTALAHELAHVRAGDDLWLRLRATAQTLFFFHPMAWWASIRHAESRELAADERVVASGVLSPRAYGRGFLAALRLGPLHGPEPAGLPVPALAIDRRRLVMRMERILAAPKPRAGRIALAAVAALSLFMLPMAETVEASPAPELARPAIEPAAAPSPAPSAVPVPILWTPPVLASTAPQPMLLLNPIPQARVTSPFGDRWNPVLARRDHHDGVDLEAVAGTPVMAPEAGVVRAATEYSSEGEDWGTVVVIDHENGYQTFFAHLGSLSVVLGQGVNKGDELGTVGTTGRVTGPHLHFEVRKNGEPIDPQPFIDGC